MFCSKCGKELNGDIQFCPYCGTPIYNEDANLEKKVDPNVELQENPESAKSEFPSQPNQQEKQISSTPPNDPDKSKKKMVIRAVAIICGIFVVIAIIAGVYHFSKGSDSNEVDIETGFEGIYTDHVQNIYSFSTDNTFHWVTVDDIFLAEKHPDRDYYVKDQYDGSYEVDGKALTMIVSGQDNEITGIIQDDGTIIIDGNKCSLVEKAFKSIEINEAVGIDNADADNDSGKSTIGEISYVIPDSWEANSSNNEYERDYYKSENGISIAQLSVRLGAKGSLDDNWKKEMPDNMKESTISVDGHDATAYEYKYKLDDGKMAGGYVLKIEYKDGIYIFGFYDLTGEKQLAERNAIMNSISIF